MKLNTQSPLHVLLFCLILIFQFSCSKDSDLMTDYVLADAKEDLVIGKFVVDDTFETAIDSPIVLDVLANDTFENEDEVIIAETSVPENGTAEINADNTITYTPETPAPVVETVDTFTYTTEVVTPDETVITETATVTVTVTTTENRAPITGDNVYFVTTTGKSSNDGTTEATAWNIQHAFATAVAGDVVYVKASNYGNLKLSTSRNGTQENPISFIGYTTSPGDIFAINGPTYTYANWISNGSDLPDNVMPHLELNPTNNDPASTDKAFSINHEYVELHNFMVSEYEVGYDVKASNVTIDNCIGDQFGNWNPNVTGWNANGYIPGEISTGYAIVVKNSSFVTVENCLMIDGGLVGYFFINGGNHTVRNNWGVAENTGNGSDYIFDFYGSDNCTITNNTAKKTYFNDSVGHQSRNMIFQAQADNNTVDGLTSYNVKFQIENSNGNNISNVNMSKTAGGGDQMGSFQIYGQSDNNIIMNLSIDGGGGIQFHGSPAGTGENAKLPHTSAGEDNYFTNVNLSNLNSQSGNALVSFHRLTGQNGITGGTNYITGLTADNFGWIINANRTGTIIFEDSTFSNGRETSIDTFYSGWGDATGSYTANFINCTFNSNNFSTPSGN